MALQKIQSFFGLKTKAKREAEKIEQGIKMYLKYIPQLRKIANNENSMDSDNEIIARLYDFYQNFDHSFPAFNSVHLNDDFSTKPDERKTVTPFSVIQELEIIPTPFTLENIDDKIALLKEKNKLVQQRFTNDQINGMIERLENRKKYKDEAKFYWLFPNTNDDHIAALLSKYKLVMEKSDLFVPAFPKEAINIMKRYTQVTKKITDKIPIFYVIAEESSFEEKRKKLDPILLVQSPFGFYWQILGAWDKEMLLLSEL